jgi:predicted nucleic acid-binding protein
MRAVFDTNILIDYLNGIPDAKALLSHYQDPWISIITRLEVLVGVRSEAEDVVTRRFLSRFGIRAVDEAICEQSVTIRRTFKLRVPDAVIYATARDQSCLLVTRNTRDFPADQVDIRFPYRL